MDERINPWYAVGQLARALRTAEDTAASEDTRQRAAHRVQAWTSVLRGMADGTVCVGSRTPVVDLPVWVTPQVVRGGFATGQALAGGPWSDDETARARSLGLPQSRAALLASWLTDDGLAELTALLDAGTYRVVLPEDAALLVVAWLVRAGAVDAAWELLDTLAPLADRLRLMPRVAPARPGPRDVVARRTAAQADEALTRVRPNGAVETQREVLSLWLPLTDDFLALWWDTRVDGVVGQRWTDEHTQIARGLVARYDAALAASPCRKYRDPKENLPVLVAATRYMIDDGTLPAAWSDSDCRWYCQNGGLHPVVRSTVGVGPPRHQPTAGGGVIADMIAKRGEPGSERLAGLRRVQAAVAQAPGRADLAQVARDRLADLPADQGIADVDAVLGAVTGAESDQARVRDDRFDLPAGAPMPPVVVRTVRLATAAPVEDLVAQGVVPSAEVLAELVPDLTAQQVGASYDDPTLGHLMALTYQAFRRRRSLLLLDLAHQVRFDELPWVAAVADRAAGRPDDSSAVGRRLAALAIDAFPATILPNPMVSELSTLLDGLDLPLTEELAEDIFEREFSAKFPRAAAVAATWLSGSLYQRYYDLPWEDVLDRCLPSGSRRKQGASVPWTHLPRDYRTVDPLLVPLPGGGQLDINSCDQAALRKLFRPGIASRVAAARPFASVDDLARVRGVTTTMLARLRPSYRWFADLCARDMKPATNRMIIERQQQLTTHNLAVLLGPPGGVVPTRPWADLAADALAAMVRLLVLAQSQDYPRSSIKDAAYALRQALVFLSWPADGVRPSVPAVVDATAALRGADCGPVVAVLDGIRHVAAGGSFDADGTCPGGGRRLVAWTVGPHWAAQP